MLKGMPYTTGQRFDPEVQANNRVFDLEACVRTLLDAIGGFSDGGQYRDSQVEPHLMFEVCMDGRRYTISIVESDIETDDLRHQLTAREWEVVRLISKGCPTKMIASLLGLRPCTISTYTKRIYLKLNVNSRAEMVAKVLSEPSLFLNPMRAAQTKN